MNGRGVHALRRAKLLVLLLLPLAVSVNASVGGVLSGKALVEALRSGGYNIYFRHAQTDWSQSDYINRAGDWESCDSSRVRQLAAGGRRTARAVGNAMRALNIPVGQVLASPYCRTVETATLMNIGPVKTTTDIVNLRVAEYFGGANAVIQRARARLAEQPLPGTNTVLVAHGNVARNATEVYPDEAEGAVFLPDGNGGFSFVGRLTPAQWVELADALAGEAY